MGQTAVGKLLAFVTELENAHQGPDDDPDGLPTVVLAIRSWWRRLKGG